MVQPRRPQVTRGLPMQQRPSAMMQAPAQPAVPARMAAFSQRSVAPSQPMVQQAAPSRMSFGAPRVAQPQAMAAVPSQVRQQTQAPQISSYVQQQAQPRQQMQRIQQNQMSAYGQPQPYMDTRGGIPPAWLSGQSGGQPQQPQPYTGPSTDGRYTNPSSGGIAGPPRTGGVTPMPYAPGEGNGTGGFRPHVWSTGEGPVRNDRGPAYVPDEVPVRLNLETEQYVPPATAAPASPVGLGGSDMERYIQQQMEEARNSASARAAQSLASQPAPTRQNADGSFMGPIGGASFTTKTGFNPENKVAGVATPAFYKQGGKVAPKPKAMAKPASRASAKPAVKGYAKGGTVMASSRGDGIAQRGKTKGRIR